MPRVSIIMATYNCEDTVEQSILSMINQTFKDWEFIICDDCSTDKTVDILNMYKDRYPSRFIIIQNDDNSKLAFSLNRCLQLAKGEYIARMDGDDESFPERLERQVTFLDEHPEYSVVGTAMIPFDENGDRSIMLATPEPQRRDLVSGPCFFHATIMMRKEAYDIVDGYYVSKRTQRAQDYDMWFRFFANDLRGYNLQEGLYHVRENQEAMKRRTLRSRCYEVQTRLKGYKLLNYPWFLYYNAFKPVFIALIPNGIMRKYHASIMARRAKKENNDGAI